MQKTLRTAFIFCLVLVLMTPVVVSALAIDTNYVPLTDIPGLKNASIQNPGGILQGLFNLAIGIGSILAIIMIIFAGFKYMYEESISGKSDAKSKITNAFFGLLLILGSYVILKTINGDLLRINLFLPKGDGKLAGLVAEKNKQDALLSFTIQQANVDYQKSRQTESALREDIAQIEKEEASIQAELDKMTRSGKSLQSPEALALQERLDVLNTSYEEKSNQADEVRRLAEEKRIGTVKQVADQQIQDALKKGDTEGALRIAQKVSSIEQTEIDRRTQNGDTTTSSLVNTKQLDDAKNSVILGMGKFLNATSNGQYPTRSDSGQTNFFNTRSSLISQINDKYTELSKIDPVMANDYRLTALVELKKVDDQWNKNLGCTNGSQTVTSDGKITYVCTQ